MEDILLIIILGLAGIVQSVALILTIDRLKDQTQARKNAMEAAKTAQEAQRRSDQRYEEQRQAMTEFLQKPYQINFNSDEIAALLAQKIGLVTARKEWVQ